MFAFSVGFLGSTEGASRTEDWLRSYARRWIAQKLAVYPAHLTVWSVDEAWRRRLTHDPELSKDAYCDRLRADGYELFDTAEAAHTAAERLVQLCNRIIDECIQSRPEGAGLSQQEAPVVAQS